MVTPVPASQPDSDVGDVDGNLAPREAGADSEWLSEVVPWEPPAKSSRFWVPRWAVICIGAVPLHLQLRSSCSEPFSVVATLFFCTFQ